MRTLDLKSDQFLTRLSNITDCILDQEFYNILKPVDYRAISDDFDPAIHGSSDEYLNLAFTKPIKDFGFPRRSLGIDLLPLHTDSSLANKIAYKKFLVKYTRLTTAIGAQFKALSMVYPENGYIGWHHNGNAPGYNILFTYSQDGDGCFKYWDYDTKSIVTVQDKPGWNVKVGYYPSDEDEPQRVYWHTAKTSKPRISLGFILNQRKMWVNLINEVSGGEYDKNIILNQGPLKDLPT